MLQINDKVIFIGGDLKGTRGTVYDNLASMNKDYVIVEMEDKSLVKAFKSELMLDNSDDLKTITLSNDDFMKLIVKVTDPEYWEDKLSNDTNITIMCLSGEIIGRRMLSELFGKGDND